VKRKFISTIVGFSVVFLSLLGAPAYGGGDGHGGGGGYGGFSGGGQPNFGGGGHATGISRDYGGAGSSGSGGSYVARPYSSGISTEGYASYAPRSSTGGQVYGSSARSQKRTASKQFARSPNRSGSYFVPRDQSGVGFARKSSTQQRAGTPAKGATRPDRAWSRQKAANRQRLDPQTKQRLRNWQGKAPGWNDAKHNHQEHWRDRHHNVHDWWHNHCDAIVLVNWGFWGWYDGWWYPAWGYDPYYSYYDYNGPIYGYDGLQPDEVIANVQSALQQLGYYSYAVDGVLGPTTESAIANYQRDYGVPVTGAIDPATVRSLGLSS